MIPICQSHEYLVLQQANKCAYKRWYMNLYFSLGVITILTATIMEIIMHNDVATIFFVFAAGMIFHHLRSVSSIICYCPSSSNTNFYTEVFFIIFSVFCELLIIADAFFDL